MLPYGSQAPTRGGYAVTVNGNNNAVGANARVTIRGTSAAPGDAPLCSRCPYKKKLEKFEKLAASH